MRHVSWILVLTLAGCASEHNETAGRTRGESRGGAVLNEPRGPAAAAGATRSFHSTRPTPAKLALLVGIDHYAPGTSERFQNLKGCVHDIEVARGVLEGRFGFAHDDVLTLIDAEATHANIVRAFREWLIERAGPQTEVVFWYSGHGSRVPDASGKKLAEENGKDSTFLAYDSRVGLEDGAYDVSDDELYSLTHALLSKTTRVFAVTDSCHSGGVMRGVDKNAARIRGADEGAKPVDIARLERSIWPKDVPFLDDGDPRRSDDLAYVHIAACSNKELAQELDTLDEKGQPQANGALSFFLTQVLLDAQPKMSFRSIADETAVRLSTRVPGQSVWSEGALERQLFGASFEPREPGFLTREDEERKLHVEAGSIVGLRKGSRLALHAGAESRQVGEAEIESIGATKSVAHWIAAPAERAKGALQAIELSRPADREPLSVYAADARLATLLAESKNARVVGDPRAAEYQLVRDSKDQRIALYGSGGVRIWRAAEAGQKPAEVTADLEQELQSEQHYRALIEIERGSLPLSATFRSPTAVELEAWHVKSRKQTCMDAGPKIESAQGGSAAAQVYLARGGYDPETELSLAMLEVVNLSKETLYVSVLSLTETRHRNLVSPPGGERDHALPPGETLVVPVNVIAERDFDSTRPMRDRYLVIGTRISADFSPLITHTTTRGSADLRMPDILKLAIAGPTTRGGMKPLVNDREAFGVAIADLLVSPLAKP